MLEANVCVNSISYVAKRSYIYRVDISTGKKWRHKLSDDDKNAIKNFESDPYNDLGTWEFLRDIYRQHNLEG